MGSELRRWREMLAWGTPSDEAERKMYWSDSRTEAGDEAQLGGGTTEAERPWPRLLEPMVEERDSRRQSEELSAGGCSG